MGRKNSKSTQNFLKSPTSLIGPNEVIQISPRTNCVHHEAELPLLSVELHPLSLKKMLGTCFGFTCVNDITAQIFKSKMVLLHEPRDLVHFAPLDLDPQQN